MNSKMDSRNRDKTSTGGSDTTPVVNVNAKTDMFEGTAWYYARFRPGYSEKLIDRLAKEANLDGKGLVIDLGCGTGQLAIPLCSFAKTVVAVDPDPDMLREGAIAAQSSNLSEGKIEWIRGSSEDLSTYLERYDNIKLVVMGRAFHWMNREEVLYVLYQRLEIGACVAMVGESSKGVTPVDWNGITKEVIKKYLGEDRKAGKSGTYNHPTKRHEEIIAESPFGQPITINFDVVRQWDIDRIIGHLYSTSYCSLPVLGDKKEAFEKELRQRLTEASLDGIFQEKVQEEIIMIRR